MRLQPDVVNQDRMHTQRKCSICGGLGHNSRGCTARPGTVLGPPASEEAVASERTLKRAHSGEDVSSDSDTEHSVQRKERKRGEDNASALVPCLHSGPVGGRTLVTLAVLVCRPPMDGGRAPQIPCRAQKARKGQSAFSPLS